MRGGGGTKQGGGSLQCGGSEGRKDMRGRYAGGRTAAVLDEVAP